MEQLRVQNFQVADELERVPACSVLHLLHIFCILLFLMTQVACGPVQNSAKFDAINDKQEVPQVSDPIPVPPPEPLKKNELWCFADKVDFELRTAISRFEMTGGTSAHAGFGIPGTPIQAINFNLRYSKGQLDSSMSLIPFLKTRELTMVHGLGEMTDLAFGAEILAGWAGGFQYQSRTPVYQISQSALVNNLANLSATLPNLGLDPWWVPVIEVLEEENGFVIPIGADGGVMKGDEFKIMSVIHDWTGKPCESELRMIRKKSTEPIVLATAEEVRTDVAFLKLKGIPKSKIELYGHVEISKLVTPKAARPQQRTELPRSVRVGRVTSPRLRFQTSNGYEEIDLAPMMSEQLKIILKTPQYSTRLYWRP